MIHKNPLLNVKRFKIEETYARFASKETIDKILELAQDPENSRIYPAVLAALYTGMRKSEIRSLTWEDVDLEFGVLRIRSKIGFKTKSKKNRLIPLHPMLSSILAKMCQPGGGLVFDLRNEKRIMGRIMKKSGILKDAWHILRHSAASYMLMSGIDIFTVSKILGHSNIRITDRYTHLLPGHFHKSIRKLKF